MKTVLHGNIDGYEVVLGFSEAALDPVSTQIKVDALSQGLAEQAAMDAFKQKIADRWARLASEFRAVFGHDPQTLNSPAEAEWFGPSRMAAQRDVDGISSQMAPLQVALDAARTKLRAENAVYFATGANEDLISEEQYAALKSAADALGKDEQAQILLSGGKAADFRGQVFWTAGKAWASRTISRLGDKPLSGEIPDSSLTADQRGQIQAQGEAARIAALSPEAKAAELAAVLSGLADQAVAMDAKASIQGLSLTGKEWYADQAATANLKYA